MTSNCNLCTYFKKDALTSKSNTRHRDLLISSSGNQECMLDCEGTSLPGSKALGLQECLGRRFLHGLANTHDNTLPVSTLKCRKNGCRNVTDIKMIHGSQQEPDKLD